MILLSGFPYLLTRKSDDPPDVERLPLFIIITTHTAFTDDVPYVACTASITLRRVGVKSHIIIIAQLNGYMLFSFRVQYIKIKEELLEDNLVVRLFVMTFFSQKRLK